MGTCGRYPRSLFRQGTIILRRVNEWSFDSVMISLFRVSLSWLYRVLEERIELDLQWMQWATVIKNAMKGDLMGCDWNDSKDLCRDDDNCYKSAE